MPYRDDFTYFLSDSDDSDHEWGNYFVYFLGDEGEVYSVLRCEAYRRVPFGCKVYECEREAESASRRLRFRVSQSQKPKAPEEPPVQNDVQPPPEPCEPQPEPPKPKTDASWRRRPDGKYDNRPKDPDYFKKYYNEHYKDLKTTCEFCKNELNVRNIDRHRKTSKICLKIRAVLEQQKSE